MRIVRPFTRAASSGMRALVQGIIHTSDALTGLTGRMNDRVEAHLSERTKLLRAHYADRATRQVKPLPVVEAPIDLSLRGGVREAA